MGPLIGLLACNLTVFLGSNSSPETWVRDQEAGGSNPLAPTILFSITYAFRPSAKVVVANHGHSRRAAFAQNRHPEMPQLSVSCLQQRTSDPAISCDPCTCPEGRECSPVRASRIIDPTPGQDQRVGSTNTAEMSIRYCDFGALDASAFRNAASSNMLPFSCPFRASRLTTSETISGGTSEWCCRVRHGVKPTTLSLATIGRESRLQHSDRILEEELPEVDTDLIACSRTRMTRRINNLAIGIGVDTDFDRMFWLKNLTTIMTPSQKVTVCLCRGEA